MTAIDRTRWPWHSAPAGCQDWDEAVWHATRRRSAEAGGPVLPQQSLEDWLIRQRTSRALAGFAMPAPLTEADHAALQAEIAEAYASVPLPPPPLPHDQPPAARATRTTPRLVDGEAVVVDLETVEPEAVQWLWPGHLALGKLSDMAGDPDVGKSTVLLDLAARVSRGDVMPDGSPGIRTPAGVLLLATAEDGLADTIVPRLIAANADLTQIKNLSGMRIPDGTTRPFEAPGDLPELRRIVAERGIRLIIVDAMMVVLPGDIDSHRDQDVRRALHPLAALAEATGAAVVLNRHFTKASGQKAIHKGGGSIAITAVARAQMLVMRDPRG